MVTGGAGYVGSWLVPELLRQSSCRIVVFDNVRNGRVEHIPDDPRIEFVRADLLDRAALRETVTVHQPSWVFHLAALHYIPYCNANPTETIQVNIVGTQNLLEALQSHPPTRLVIASTAAVYPPNDLPNREDDRLEPIDIYGFSKLANEHQVRLFAGQQKSCKCIAARLFNVFGPRETNPHVVPEIVRQVFEGQDELDLGNVKPKRDYVYTADVARALVALARTDHASFRAFNVGTGVEHSVEEIVDELARITGRDLRIRTDPSRVRASERMHLVCDRKRISEETGWQPQYDLVSGLEELWGSTVADESKSIELTV